MAHELDLLDGRQTLGRLLATYKDAVGILKILDCRPLGKELGIGEHLKSAFLGIGPEDSQEGGSRAYRKSALLDNDLGPFGNLGDHPCCSLDIFEISRLAGPDTVILGGSPHAHKDDVRIANGSLDICGKEQVLSAG